MRDIFLVAIIIVGLGATLRYPFAGVLLWTWLTCMDPHRNAFGFAQTAPLNLIVAIVTAIAWLFSRERKIPPTDATFVLLLLFLAWITINGFFAVDPAWSWPLWDRTWKIIALGLFVGAMATNKIRVHALMWAVVISLFFYSIKGGVFTILTGGHSRVLGPQNSMIGDNNMLAASTLMVLPLANYLRMHTARRWLSLGLLVAIALSTISVIGSYSRGGFVGLGGLSIVAWIRSRKKLMYPIAAAMVLIPAYFLMPQSYFDRLNTINSAASDDSFHGRVVAWQVAWRYANDHFPFGAGFSGPELPTVFLHYFPTEITHAAHSIFFQVLGDNGYFGLGLYLAILVLAFVNCWRIRKLTRGKAELAWAFDLAGMIQLSLFVFCLAGSVLSLAYYDVLFILAGLLPAMRVMLTESAVSRSAPLKELSPQFLKTS